MAHESTSRRSEEQVRHIEPLPLFYNNLQGEEHTREWRLIRSSNRCCGTIRHLPR